MDCGAGFAKSVNSPEVFMTRLSAWPSLERALPIFSNCVVKCMSKSECRQARQDVVTTDFNLWIKRNIKRESAIGTIDSSQNANSLQFLKDISIIKINIELFQQLNVFLLK
jgi:hypothetical protein